MQLPLVRECLPLWQSLPAFAPAPRTPPRPRLFFLRETVPSFPHTTSKRRGRTRVSSTNRLGSWRLVQRLARGMCTDIFVARPMRSTSNAPCDYVVKTLRAEFESDPILVDTINREAAAGRKLSHAHIISILAAHTHMCPYYVVMPRLEGATVRRAIDAVGPLVIPQALWIARQVAAALAEMHRCRLLHCDVKPSNIFVTETGHATLFDLGFATSWEGCPKAPAVDLRGTLAYIAPEMLTSTTALGPWSDVYSLGVTLFEMLTGRLPFTQDSPARMAQSHLRDIPPSPRTFVPQLPRSVARLLRRMMAKEPSRRPTDDLVETLMRLEIETFGLRSA